MSDLSFEISTKDLAALVKPVIPLANKDGMLPSLNAVNLRSSGKYLVASATDRYRAGMCRCVPTEPPPVGLNIIIGLDELRRILAVFKSDRNVERHIGVTVSGDKIRVEQAMGLGFMDASMTFPLVTGTFPILKDLFDDARRSEPVAMVAVNASYFADFRHAVREGEPLIVRSANENRPLIVSSGDHFIGAIMPTRLSTGDLKADPLTDWAGLTAPPVEKAETKARTKKTGAAA